MIKFVSPLMSLVILFAVLLFVPNARSESENKIVDQQTETVKPIDDKPEKHYNAVVEYKSADWCYWCRVWKKSGAREAMERKGWKFVESDDVPGGMPSFRVWVNGKSETFNGFSSRKAFYAKINSIVKRLKTK